MSKTRNSGFTLTEVLIAMVVLVITVLLIVQVVPSAMMSNLRNQYDSSSVVVAERLLNQMLSQPIGAGSFLDADGRLIQLGGGVAGTAGGPLQTINLQGGRVEVRLNFTAAAIPNYNFTYVDPNDPVGVSYEVRWAVNTQMAGPLVVSKRFFVGVWKRDPRGVMPPVTLEAWVQR
jgi:prepilin-type N-terminal cleavage/methylation domain-containing protein